MIDRATTLIGLSLYGLPSGIRVDHSALYS